MPKKPFQSEFHILITELLSEQGVDVMNGVLEQLIHFSHGFVTQLRGTAQDLTSGSEAVTVEDIHFANDLRSFPQSRIQQQDIHRMASRVNTRPFPRIERHQGLSLPNEEHCLLANNYQYGKLSSEVDNKSEVIGKKRKARNEAPQPQSSQQKSAKKDEIDFTALEAEIEAELEAGLEAENPKRPKSAESTDSEPEAKEDTRQVQNEEGSNGNDDNKRTPLKGGSSKTTDVTRKSEQDRVVDVHFDDRVSHLVHKSS